MVRFSVIIFMNFACHWNEIHGNLMSMNNQEVPIDLISNWHHARNI